jgi:O-antigen ligase
VKKPILNNSVSLIGPLGVLTTIFITPWTSIDPINIGKMIVLVTGGVFVFIAGWANIKRQVFSLENSALLAVLSVFATQIVISTLFSGSKFVLQLYGTFGRNTGALTYLALVLILLISASATLHDTKLILRMFTLAGLLSTIYGTLQSLGKDPIPWSSWNPVIGFLGNTNFQSSLLGLFGIQLFAILYYRLLKAPYLLISSLVLIQVIRLILRTYSQQGLIVFIVGTIVIVLVHLYVNKYKVLYFVGAIFTSGLAVISILGIFQIGVLSKFLYKESVSFRGDYWRAGIEMIKENPLTGVGMDAYGEWYRYFRDDLATQRRGPGVISDSAHNLIIDLAANGGLILAIAYICLNLIVIRAVFRRLRKGLEEWQTLGVLLALWIGFHAQSIISVNQIGLTIWGWIFSGLILARCRINGQGDSKIKRTDPVTLGVTSRLWLKSVTGASLALVISFPPFAADMNLKKSFETTELLKIKSAATYWPPEETRLLRVAIQLYQNGFTKDGQELALYTTREFPRSFDAWNFLYNSIESTDIVREDAKRKLLTLDPHNREFVKKAKSN